MNEAVPLKTLKTQPLNLPKNRDAFYGGKWHKPISGRSAGAINPGTGESLGPVADCGTADIDAAVNAAKAAYPAWRAMAPKDRAYLLRRLAAGVEREAEKLAVLGAHAPPADGRTTACPAAASPSGRGSPPSPPGRWRPAA